MGNLLDGVAFADPVPTIHAVPSGGNWNSPGTWVENRVPNASDVVEINGTVQVNITASVSGLIVTGSATLQPTSNYDRTLTINGDVINNGTIRDYSSYYELFLYISGNITNNGTWSNDYTYLFGTNSRSIEGSQPINSTYVSFNDSFTITSNPVFGGITASGDNTITMSAGHHMTILGSISGDTSQRLTIVGGPLVLAGNVTVRNDTVITAKLIIEAGATLQPTSNYDRTLTINGDVINNGTIRDYSSYYELFLYISGNITNNGTWSNDYTYLFGTNSRSIEGSQPINSTYVSFNDSFTITSNPVFGGITASGDNTITMSAGHHMTILGSISGDTSQRLTIVGGPLVLAGNVTVRNDTVITAKLIIEAGATLQPTSNYDRTLTINGDVINNGTIQDYSSYYQLLLYISGNITNNGTWTNDYTYVTWPSVNGASYYEFYIAGQDIVQVSGTSYDISDYLHNNALQDTTHYWRVRAIVGGTPTDWSEAKSIIVHYHVAIQAHPMAYAFEAVDVGNQSPPLPFSIANTGNLNLNIGAINLTGADAAEFIITSDNCSSQVITPTNFCTVVLVFAPNTTGGKNANLLIPSNAPETLEVALVGGGLPGQAMLIAPSGTINTIQPTFTWRAVDTATQYRLSVTDASSQTTQWQYTASEAACPGGTGTCTVTPNISLPTGDAHWQVQTGNELGNGLWSRILNFRVETLSGVLQFSADNYTVNEGEGTAIITVTRTRGTAGVVSVDYASTNDTAIAGSDYTSVSDTLSWADGEATAKTFTVNIIDDSTVENEERLYLSLGNATGGAVIGNPDIATLTITDNDSGSQSDIIIDFGTQYGIWLRMNNSTWVQLHTLSPESMVTGDIDVNGQDEVIIDFGETYGIWLRMNNSTWVQLHTLSPESMVTGDIDGGGQDDVIIDFGEPHGIWVLMNNSSWIQLHTLSPESLVTGDIDGGGQDEVIIDFGETYGIWVRMNNSSWVQLHTLSPESMVTGDIDNSGQDEVIIDFGSLYGIWLMMNNSNWVQLHTLSPESMVTGDIDGGGQDDVIIDFGSPYGIWLRMNNSSWVQLHNISPESLVTGDIDGSGQDEVIIDFGASYGIWQWMNNSNWVQLHSLSPEFMVTGNLDGLESDTAISHQAPEDNTMLLPEPIAVPLPKAVTPSGQ